MEPFIKPFKISIKSISNASPDIHVIQNILGIVAQNRNTLNNNTLNNNTLNNNTLTTPAI